MAGTLNPGRSGDMPVLESRALRTIPCANGTLRYRGRPLVMGIINATPDSFSDGGMFRDPATAAEHGRRLAEQGADLLDIGGESTRPGAAPVSAEEELRRVVPVIRRLARLVRIPMSIDTSKSVVAEAALDAGAALVNDVTALRDPDMAAVAARSRAAVVLMHMRGSPRTMQRRPRYRDVVEEVAVFLLEAARHAESAGIAPERIIVDPGLGFGKTAAHNVELLQSMDRIVRLGYPVLVGPSRKSFIGSLAGGEAHERLGGTLAAVDAARRAGAHIVRVHDVQPVVQFLRMSDALEDRDAARRQH